MNKKTVRNLIIAGTVGLTATTVGLTTALTACSTTATQTFSAESIANLKSAILNTITADRLTRSEFNADMFDIVCDNFISNDENLGKLVNEVTFSEQNSNRIIIKLNSTIKYSLPEDFNDKSVALRENTLYITFDALNFYQVISFNDVSFNVNALTQLRNSILNVVSTIGVGNFNETELQNSAAIINAINNTKTSDNVNLSNYINTPTYSQETNSINITLKDDIGLYAFNPVSLEGIQVTKNTISLILESPESWFTWGTEANANQITGLSDEGKQQTDIILPSRATSLAIGAFTNVNNDIPNLTSFDMSLTKMTELPSYEGGQSDRFSLFYNCATLKNIVLPNTLISIGSRSFLGTGITSITIPSSVTSMRDYLFWRCNLLTSIKILSNSLTTTTKSFSFNSSFSQPLVITVPNASVQTAVINGGLPSNITLSIVS